MSKELNKVLAEMQVKMKAKKSSYNSFGKYYFRKSEDILEAIKPFLIESGVTVTINERVIELQPVPMILTTAILSNGVDTIEATAIVGVDLNQKGMQTSQQFGAASTYGKKYALGNLFLIDDTEDADSGKPKPEPNIKVKITKPQMEKAKTFIAGGGSLEAIKGKYILTEAQTKELSNE